MTLNVRSAYVATREAGVHFREQGSGVIVNISSDAGIDGVKGGAHYASSKAARQMFTTVTAAEWGRYGIRANCIAVGAIASERVVKAWEVAGIDQADRRRRPAGQTGQARRSCVGSLVHGQRRGVLHHGPDIRRRRRAESRWHPGFLTGCWHPRAHWLAGGVVNRSYGGSGWSRCPNALAVRPPTTACKAKKFIIDVGLTSYRPKPALDRRRRAPTNGPRRNARG